MSSINTSVFKKCSCINTIQLEILFHSNNILVRQQFLLSSSMDRNSDFQI